jgi:hypothetical protein
MNDALRTLPSFPLTEPFTAMGYAETGYVSGATIGASVLSTTGNNAIVDWVLVEMRPASDAGNSGGIARSALATRWRCGGPGRREHMSASRVLPLAIIA